MRDNKKKTQEAVNIAEDDVEYYDHATQFNKYVKSRSRSRSGTPKGKGKDKGTDGKASPVKRGKKPSSSHQGDEDVSGSESGDEAELLNEEQMHELDVIYQRSVEPACQRPSVKRLLLNLDSALHQSSTERWHAPRNGAPLHFHVHAATLSEASFAVSVLKEHAAVSGADRQLTPPSQLDARS